MGIEMMKMNTSQSPVNSGAPKDGNSLCLPRRGCTKACGNYTVCEDRPWRTLSEHN